MNTDDKSMTHYRASGLQHLYFLFLIVPMLAMWSSFVAAQGMPQGDPGMEPEHQHEMVPRTLSEQIGDLSHQVSELQAKVKQQGVDFIAMKANGDERRSKMSMGTLTGMPQTPPLQPMSPANANQGAGMMAGMMSMMSSMMGGMGSAAPMGQAASMGVNGYLSELPGFPGSSHLYHIGATNFFLDHPQHITLSLEQQSRLGEIRMKSQMSRAELTRRIQETEEQVWLLTAADQPNLVNIEAKIRESEKLQGDFRLSFIKDVGEAAKLLSGEQRNALLGQTSPPVQVAPAATPASPAMGGM